MNIYQPSHFSLEEEYVLWQKDTISLVLLHYVA